MSEDNTQPVLRISLTYEQLGLCVDIARAVNMLSYRIPGMLWRAQWEEAVAVLDHLDPTGVLNKTLDVLSVRLAFLESWIATDETVPVGATDAEGYKRFTAEDLECMKDLLVRADRTSVEALASNRAVTNRRDLHTLASAVSALVLAADLLQHERQSVEAWLRSGRGIHGVSDAVSNRDFVRLILEALDGITFIPRGWPPRWLNLMLVSRAWCDAVRFLGRYVALPPNAAQEVVESSLHLLPTARMMICTLSYLSITGANGLIVFLDLLKGAHVLTTLRVAGWVQCDATSDVNDLEVVTLPRVKDFELIGTQNNNPPYGTVSLIRYLRLPAVEYAALSGPVECMENTAALRVLASHLEAVAAALPSTSPCIRRTRRYTICTDTRSGGLVLRTHPSLDHIFEDGLPTLTVHIYSPPSSLEAKMSSSPLAMHLFIRLCQTLAPLMKSDGALKALHLDSLAAVNAKGMRNSPGLDFVVLRHRPPWKNQNDCRRTLLGLPIYRHSFDTSARPARITLFLDTPHRELTALLPIRALDLQQLDQVIPSEVQLQEPAIESIEVYGAISTQLLRQKIWQFPEFHEGLRIRYARGVPIHKVVFIGEHTQRDLPLHSLKEAARSWGDGVDVQCKMQDTSITLVFDSSQ